MEKSDIANCGFGLAGQEESVCLQLLLLCADQRTIVSVTKFLFSEMKIWAKNTLCIIYLDSAAYLAE